MKKLDELIRFALDQLVADGPAEIVFECREDGLHIRELIDSTWHRVVPVAMGWLRNSYGLQGDLFDAVLAFFQAEVPNDGRTTGQRIKERARALNWRVDGKQVRVTFESWFIGRDDGAPEMPYLPASRSLNASERRPSRGTDLPNDQML